MSIEMPEKLSEFIDELPAGGLFFHILYDCDNKTKVPTFILKETNHYVDLIPNPTGLQTKLLAEQIDHVLLIDILMKFKEIDDNIYETTINISNEHGQSLLKSLANSDFFYLLIFNENMNQRLIQVPNSFKDSITQIMFKAKNLPDVDDFEFFDAKRIFFEKHPDIKDLFNSK